MSKSFYAVIETAAAEILKFETVEMFHSYLSDVSYYDAFDLIVIGGTIAAGRGCGARVSLYMTERGLVA